MLRAWRSLLPGKTEEASPATIGIGNGKIPIEILQHIFSHLTFLDTVSCRLACRLWSRASYDFPHTSRGSPQQPRQTPHNLGEGKLAKRTLHFNHDGAPLLYINVTIAMKHLPNGSVADLRITGLSPASARHDPGLRMHPILSPENKTDLERLAKYHLSTLFSRFTTKTPPWLPHMSLSMPPTNELEVSINFQHDLTKASDHTHADLLLRDYLTAYSSRELLTSNTGGLSLEDLARHVARELDGMRNDVQVNEARYRKRRKEEVKEVAKTGMTWVQSRWEEDHGRL